ncbi:putative G3BP-like protein [Colletotrichum sp. SAR11_59]|nr:putative G3BP-like protein [Colletotrichum sp. SAR11_59]
MGRAVLVGVFVVDNRLEVAIPQDATSTNSEAEVPVPEPVKVPETKAEEPTVPEVTAKEIADEVLLAARCYGYLKRAVRFLLDYNLSRRLIAASPHGARRLNHGFDSDSDYESNNEWRHEAVTESGGKRKEKTPRELFIKSQSRRN